MVGYELVIIPGLIVLAALVGYLPGLAAYAAAMDRMTGDKEWAAFLNRVGTISSTVDLTILKPLPESGLQ